jgi:pimeloyl-ACP methyl ester carboxylesterase
LEHQIFYKNTPITYTDSGKGTALVLLHGFLENRKMWDPFLPELSKRYRIISIDLLGHGETAALGYVHTMEDNADAVHAVLHSLRIRKCVFAGHSMGGYVALAFAELYAEQVKGIILINSTSVADSDERKVNRDRAIRAVKQNYSNFVNLSIANLFSENNRERLAGEIADVKEQALLTPLQGIVASLEGMKIRKNREVLLHFAQFPILFILGKQDPVLNYTDALEQIEGTSAKVVTFADGHMSPIENREDLMVEIKGFMKKVG